LHPLYYMRIDIHSKRNLSYVWNIVDGQSYPFLSWQ
jgi:hypothetical protein